jgi:hypothetical protein
LEIDCLAGKILLLKAAFNVAKVLPELMVSPSVPLAGENEVIVGCENTTELFPVLNKKHNSSLYTSFIRIDLDKSLKQINLSESVNAVKKMGRNAPFCVLSTKQ